MLISLASGFSSFKEALLFSLLCYAAVALYRKKMFHYKKAVLCVISLHLLFACIYTGLQFFLWKESPLGNQLLHAPLPPETPLGVFEFARNLVDGDRGYFVYYSLTHFFLKYAALGGIVILLGLLAQAWVRMKGGSITEKDAVAAIFFALILSWPNALLLVPCVLIILIAYSSFESLHMLKRPVTLEQASLIAALFIFFFGTIVLEQLNLYTLLVL